MRSLSYRNQSIDLQIKPMNWFLYGRTSVMKELIPLCEKWPNSKFSSSYFPAFRLNTEIYEVKMRKNTDQKNCKYVRFLRAASSSERYWVTSKSISTKCSILYKNQSYDLRCKSNDWFLYKMQHWAEMD